MPRTRSGFRYKSIETGKELDGLPIAPDAGTTRRTTRTSQKAASEGDAAATRYNTTSGGKSKPAKQTAAKGVRKRAAASPSSLRRSSTSRPGSAYTPRSKSAGATPSKKRKRSSDVQRNTPTKASTGKSSATKKSKSSSAVKESKPLGLDPILAQKDAGYSTMEFYHWIKAAGFSVMDAVSLMEANGDDPAAVCRMLFEQEVAPLAAKTPDVSEISRLEGLSPKMQARHAKTVMNVSLLLQRQACVETWITASPDPLRVCLHVLSSAHHTVHVNDYCQALQILLVSYRHDYQMALNKAKSVFLSDEMMSSIDPKKPTRKLPRGFWIAQSCCFCLRHLRDLQRRDGSRLWDSAIMAVCSLMDMLCEALGGAQFAMAVKYLPKGLAETYEMHGTFCSTFTKIMIIQMHPHVYDMHGAVQRDLIAALQDPLNSHLLLRSLGV